MEFGSIKKRTKSLSQRFILSAIFGLTLFSAMADPKLSWYPSTFPCEKDKYGSCSMSTDAVYGRLVDKSTGRPLQGVVVLGYWPSTMDRYEGWQITVGVARLDETISDENGDFMLPACIPPSCEIKHYVKRGQPGTETLQGFFAPQQPDIVFFKEGYYPKGLYNPPPAKRFDIEKPEDRHWSWAWNGEIVELEPVVDEDDPRLKAAYTISPRLYLNESCNWMRIPKTLLFKVKQMRGRERDQKRASISPVRYLMDTYLDEPERCHLQAEQLLLEHWTESLSRGVFEVNHE